MYSDYWMLCNGAIAACAALHASAADLNQTQTLRALGTAGVAAERLRSLHRDCRYQEDSDSQHAAPSLCLPDQASEPPGRRDAIVRFRSASFISYAQLRGN